MVKKKKSLCEINYLIIRLADKGGGTVLLRKQDYLEEMENLLSYKNTYMILKKGPPNQYKKLLNNLIQENFRKGLINKKENYFLFPLAPKIPIMYYLPKVHKNSQKPPGRIDLVTSCIGKFIDFLLQPLVRT